jgi:undecaprenyl-diphosphatase
MVDNKVKKTWLKYSLVIFFLLITLAIGISRVYLRVHYASDVIAGFAISLVWLVISLVILRQIEKYKTINN